jgi:pimeloyl-ACP methyl ester carboxylesterase
MGLASAPVWSDAEAETFARTAVQPAPVEPFMLEAARRTPGQARERFFANALFEPGDDQRRIAETAQTPLAIVNGADDPFLNHAYFPTLRYANLWRGQVFSLEGLGHAPFWQAPAVFDPLLAAFVAETMG